MGSIPTFGTFSIMRPPGVAAFCVLRRFVAESASEGYPPMSRHFLLSLIAALALGASLGLIIGWVISPVRYVDTAPQSLQQIYKDDYILMLATAYARDHDLAAAEEGLRALGFAAPGTAVEAAAKRLMLQRPQPAEDVRRLASLASALGITSPELAPYLP